MKVEDPALFLYASFDRHLPGHVAADPRELALRLFRRFQRVYGLRDASAGWGQERVKDVSLDGIDRAQDGLVRWIRRTRTGPLPERPPARPDEDPQPARQQAALYSFGDSLFFYLMDSLGTRTEDFGEAWEGLSACPRALLGSKHWEAAAPGFFGLNIVCSVLFDDERGGPPDRSDVISSLARISPVRPARIETKLGDLWAVGNDWVGLPVDPNMLATWVLVSPRSMEDHVYRALQPSGPEPPSLSLLFASRQKFWTQLARYDEARERVRRARVSLDKRVGWMIETQRDFEEQTAITDSQEMEELRRKSVRANTDLAALEAEVVRIRDLQTTLEINLRNYGSSSEGFRVEGGEDQLLQGEQAHMARRAQQVDYDTRYHEGALGRARAALASADAGFNISQDRQQARQVRLGVVQVSGLFASLIALIATEVFRLGEVARDRPALAAKVLLLVLTGTFAAAQVLQGWGRIRTALTSSALALAAGVGVLLLLDRDAGAWWHYVLAAVSAAAAFTAVRMLEERPRREAVPAWRTIRDTERIVEKLRRANEEISDLLDDLPTTRIFRLKTDRSFLGKIDEKRKHRPDYSERDVGDAIGIRYVVSPFQLPTVVDRVERILDRRADFIEYKSGRYKAVHIDVDVLGIGARRVNLKAEVQIKTPLQNWYATRAHDVLYKDVPGSGHLLLRTAARWGPSRWVAERLLAFPAAVEMLLFRRWMRWPRRGEEGTRDPRWRLREVKAEREGEAGRTVEDLFAAGGGVIPLVRISP